MSRLELGIAPLAGRPAVEAPRPASQGSGARRAVTPEELTTRSAAHGERIAHATRHYRAPMVERGTVRPSPLLALRRELSAPDVLDHLPLREIAADPALCTRYVREMASGRRDPYETYAYSQACLAPDDLLSDFAMATAFHEYAFRRDPAYHGEKERREAIVRRIGARADESLGLRMAALNPIESRPAVTALRVATRSPAANPLRRRAFVKMLTQVIAEESRRGVQPRLGTAHTWGAQFTSEYRARFPESFLLSKLLMALVLGETARVMVSGSEARLAEYVVAQADDSVTFDALFRASYVINDGDVYLTLLTMENVLARHWREPDRNHRAVSRRLAPIAYCRDTQAGVCDDDKFGSWYHLVGVMLYGYVAGLTRGAFVGAMANFDMLARHVVTRSAPQWQEAWINQLGAVIGGQLRRVVKHGRYRAHFDDPGALSPARYLAPVAR